jgi:hypothetical protein
MPNFWNNILVVTIDELVPEYYTYSALAKSIKRAEQRGYGINRVRIGGGGHPMLIEFDSLPQNIKESLHDPRKGKHVLEQFFSVDKDIVEWYRDYTFTEDGTSIKEETQDKYIANACLLRACQRLRVAREAERASKGYGPSGVMNTIWKDCMSFAPIMKSKFALESSLPEAESRWRETYNKFQQQGLVSLISKKHGNNNAKKGDEELEKLLTDMFATQTFKPTYADITRQYESFLSGYLEVINNATGELYSPKGFPALSKSTVYNYLNTYDNRIGAMAKRSGDRQRLMGATLPYHSLIQPETAGCIISIDDRQPPFEYAKGQRMWFYNGIDLGSEAFVAWVYGKTKEGIILEFYRQLVRNYAEWGFQLPAEIECESSLNSSFASTFLRPGYMFEHVRIEANNARGKRIEAYYKPLRYQLEKQHAGWLARPFALSESNQAGSHKTPTVPYDKLAEQCLGDIETWNNMPHSKFTDKTRWEVFCERQNPNLKPTNYKAFLRYLGYKTTTSCKAGIIKFQQREWLLGDNGKIYFGQHLINLMRLVEGENVDVYWLDDNQGGVLKALVYQGDTFICEALPKPQYHRSMIEQTPADAEAREIMSKYVITIEAYQRKRKNAIEPVTIIDNTPLTLNNKFQISRLHKSRPEHAGVEILPEPDEPVLTGVEVSFKRSLKDRF